MTFDLKKIFSNTLKSGCFAHQIFMKAVEKKSSPNVMICMNLPGNNIQSAGTDVPHATGLFRKQYI